jgi:hypothetical protein
LTPALGAPAVHAQEKSEKVNQQGGAMSASMAKSKIKKMSTAELIRPDVPRQIEPAVGR